MNDEHWACVGAGSGATGLAIYAAQGNTVGAFAFGVVVLVSVVAALVRDLRKVRRESGVR